MLKRIYRLKKKKEFSYVYRKKEKYIGKYISIYKTSSLKLSIGFSVSKKTGNAVTRNLYKRRLQHIVKKYLPLLSKGNYVIVANAGIKKASFQQLDADILFLIYKF